MSKRPKLADPTELIWPVVDGDKEKSIVDVLENVFSKYKSCLRTIKKPPKWKQKQGSGDKQDSLSEEEEQQKKEFKSLFVVGVQSVMRSLERDRLSAVLLWRDMQPAVLRKALLHLLHEHGCIATCVSDLLSPIQKSWPGLTSAACLGILKTEVPNDFHELITTVRKHAPPLTNQKEDKEVKQTLTESKVKADTASSVSETSKEPASRNCESEVKEDTACIKLDSSNNTSSRSLIPPVVDPHKYYIYKSKPDDGKSFSGQSFIGFDEVTVGKVQTVETVKGVRVKTKGKYVSSKDQISFGIRPSLIDYDNDHKEVIGNVITCGNIVQKENDISNRKRKAADNDEDTDGEYKKINVKKFQKNTQKKTKNKKNKKK